MKKCVSGVCGCFVVPTPPCLPLGAEYFCMLDNVTGEGRRDGGGGGEFVVGDRMETVWGGETDLCKTSVPFGGGAISAVVAFVCVLATHCAHVRVVLMCVRGDVRAC